MGAPKKILNQALNKLTRIASNNIHITLTKLVHKLETVRVLGPYSQGNSFLKQTLYQSTT